MATYLLLRDNKESGPFSMNDLLAVGLKPYDLVWVPGKSAAWRYPSEIEELKPFAPTVEEQPFDRFYKKPTIAAEEQETPPAQQSRYAPLPVKEKEPVAEPTINARRTVFVTLPNQQTVPVERPLPQPKKAVQPVPLPQEPEPGEIETKYSQPLDDIKEMYVKTLMERKTRSARRTIFVAGMKKAAVLIGLVAVGIITGLMLRSGPDTNQVLQQASTPSSPLLAAPIVKDTNVNGMPEQTAIQSENIDTDPQASTQTVPQTDNRSTPTTGADERPALTIRKETMIKPTEKKEFDTNQAAPPVNIDPITGERIKKLRTGNAQPEELSLEKNRKSPLHDLVSVETNDYKRVAFGGIRNLQLTVTNHSRYELDQVIVELQYLKPSEEPLRTENISFRGVGANASSTIRIPDTNRGIKINYRIVNIESKQNADAVAGR